MMGLTSNDIYIYNDITWFHLNHAMVSRRIYNLPVSFYGGYSITVFARFFSNTPVLPGMYALWGPLKGAIFVDVR